MTAVLCDCLVAALVAPPTVFFMAAQRLSWAHIQQPVGTHRLPARRSTQRAGSWWVVASALRAGGDKAMLAAVAADQPCAASCCPPAFPQRAASR